MWITQLKILEKNLKQPRRKFIIFFLTKIYLSKNELHPTTSLKLSGVNAFLADFDRPSCKMVDIHTTWGWQTVGGKTEVI